MYQIERQLTLIVGVSSYYRVFKLLSWKLENYSGNVYPYNPVSGNLMEVT